MKKEYVFILLFSFLIFGNCINEDNSDCPYGKYVLFKIINPKYQYKEVVDKVDLYLYNEEEILVGEYSYSKAQLEGSELKAMIPYDRAGNYSIVALINQSERYLTFNKGELKELRTELLTDEGDSVKFKLADIYHSYKEVSFKGNTAMTNDTMYLSKNTNHINLEIEIHDYDLPDNASLVTHICGNNGTYNFSNKSVGNRKITYLPHSSDFGDIRNEIMNFRYLFTIMRLWIGDDLKICLEQHEPGTLPETLAEVMLTEEIAKLENELTGEKLYDTDEKLELEDEFDIRIVFDNTFTIIELKINDWFVIKPEIEL